MRRTELVVAACLFGCSSGQSETKPPADAAADVTTQADGATPPEDAGVDAPDDASMPDTSTPGGPCGISLVGPNWSSTCQAWMDSNCCAGEQYCAGYDQCNGWVGCIDACGTMPAAGCTKKCGQVSILFGPAYNCMTGPPDGSPPLPSGCSWP